MTAFDRFLSFIAQLDAFGVVCEFASTWTQLTKIDLGAI